MRSCREGSEPSASSTSHVQWNMQGLVVLRAGHIQHVSRPINHPIGCTVLATQPQSRIQAEDKLSASPIYRYRKCAVLDLSPDRLRRWRVQSRAKRILSRRRRSFGRSSIKPGRRRIEARSSAPCGRTAHSSLRPETHNGVCRSGMHVCGGEMNRL